MAGRRGAPERRLPSDRQFRDVAYRVSRITIDLQQTFAYLIRRNRKRARENLRAVGEQLIELASEI